MFQVSSLIITTLIADVMYGLLSCNTMDQEFKKQGCDSNFSKLIRTFLCQFHIIHQVSKDYCLVPSAISAIPAIPKHVEVGSFPRKAMYMYRVQQLSTIPSLPSVLPIACNSPEEIQLKVTDTGLIYRRFMLLPPIASGFWSKLIAIFLQKKDFNKLVAEATPIDLSLKSVGPAHRLRSMIGDLELSWVYWKTGIMLYISEFVALRVNSYQTHEFEDPLLASSSVFASRQKMLSNFLYQGEDGYQSVPAHYKEVIEVVVPEIYIEGTSSGNLGGVGRSVQPLSAKLLAKALEIIDEVVKNHCEHLTTTGIYSLNDMRHVIPCPLCYGDEDQREQPHRPGSLEDSVYSINPLESLRPGLTALRGGNLIPNHVSLDHSQGELEASTASQAETRCSLPDGSIWVFTAESCIEQTFSSDVVLCPKHGPLEIECLAPDLVRQLCYIQGCYCYFCIRALIGNVSSS